MERPLPNMHRLQDLGKKMVESQPTLWDLDARFRIMDRYDDYMQVIAMIGPPVESVATRTGGSGFGENGQRRGSPAGCETSDAVSLRSWQICRWAIRRPL